MVVSLSQQAQVWEKVLEEAKKRLESDKHLYDVFFSSTVLHKVDGNKMTILCDSQLAIKTFTSNAKISTILQDSIKAVTESEYELYFITKDDIKTQKEPDASLQADRHVFFSNSKLNPKYTFDNFIVGECNKEALQASLLVSSNLGTQFNPLFLYSKPGLGKTHLLHAIGNYIKEKKPYAKVLYISTDEFIDEFIRYVKGEQQEESLKDFMKSIDVLLVDDIQFLADKKKTMEMFFFIFNALVSNDKQIVLTSDRHPSELQGLEERLVSRFNQGLSVSLLPPDTDTLLNILKNKITANGLDIRNFSPDGLKFLAENFCKSVRDLEGALNRLLFYTINFKKTDKIDLETVIESVKPMMNSKQSQHNLDEDKIIQQVASFYNLTDAQIKSKSRISQIALARQIAMYLCRSMCGTPYSKIGKLFGGRDHSTVMTSVEKVETMLKTDPQLSTVISKIKKNIKQ